MSSPDDRQARLLEYYEEPQEIEYLDEHLNDEVVLDMEFFSSQSVNDKKIKKLMENLKYISVKHSTWIKCIYYYKTYSNWQLTIDF